MKHFRISDLEDRQVIHGGIEIHKKLHHQFIIQYYGEVIDRNSICVFVEFMELVSFAIMKDSWFCLKSQIPYNQNLWPCSLHRIYTPQSYEATTKGQGPLTTNCPPVPGTLFTTLERMKKSRGMTRIGASFQRSEQGLFLSIFAFHYPWFQPLLIFSWIWKSVKPDCICYIFAS